MDFWQMMEQDAPTGCSAVRELADWSTNYDGLKSPYILFLDMIGWSQKAYGETVFPYGPSAGPSAVIGWREADLLGRALIAWANNPTDVVQYVYALAQASLETES